MSKTQSTLGTPGGPGHYVGAVATPAVPKGTPSNGNVVGGTPDAAAFYHGGNGKNITPDQGVTGGQTAEVAHD